jgi:hypothetical protein
MNLYRKKPQERNIMKFERLSSAVHPNQPGMLRDRLATHNRALNSVETFEIKKV